ncbi:zinc-binding dehydrogenase [Paraburkholderia sp. JPY465]
MAGAIDVRIGGVYPLEQAAKAHEDMESRSTTGELRLIH